jgi:hypothetical protein
MREETPEAEEILAGETRVEVVVTPEMGVMAVVRAIPGKCLPVAVVPSVLRVIPRLMSYSGR